MAESPTPQLTATKELLLDQLHEVFTLHGFHGSTLAHLARASGLSKASLYHHFPGGKNEIAATLVRRAIAQCHRNAYRHLTEGSASATRVARFLAGMLDYTSEGERPCLLVTFGQEALTEESLNTVIRQQFADWQASIASAYERAGHKRKRAERLAEELMTSLYGAMLLARLHNEPRILRQHVKRTTKSLG